MESRQDKGRQNILGSNSSNIKAATFTGFTVEETHKHA